MGNLTSCVSCRTKEDKRIEKSLSELGLGDFKGASFNDEVIRLAEGKNGEAQVGKLTTGQEGDHAKSATDTSLTVKGGVKFADDTKKLLSLKEWRELTGVDTSQLKLKEPELDAIEEAAKVIVDVTLFITTQIVYPAYVRYLQEDHPEVYIQYYGRPDTPVPPSETPSTDLTETRTYTPTDTQEEVSPRPSTVSLADTESEPLETREYEEDNPG